MRFQQNNCTKLQPNQCSKDEHNEEKCLQCSCVRMRRPMLQGHMHAGVPSS